MSEVAVVGIDLNNKKLAIFDLGDPSCRIEVDQVIFQALRVDGLKAEGVITAVHGLPVEVADQLPPYMLRALGVAPQLTPPSRRFVKGARPMRATAGDNRFVPVHAP